MVNTNTAINVFWMPIQAIKNPPNAWPVMEASSQLAELIAAAAGKISLGTTWEMREEKVGPLKARMAPVTAIIPHIPAAMLQGP